MTGTAHSYISIPLPNRHTVTCLHFDSNKIITGSDDGTIEIHDPKTGALQKKLSGHQGSIWDLQCHGSTLVSVSTEKTVRVWDLSRGVCTHVFHGHTATVRQVQIVLPVEVEVSRYAEGKSVMRKTMTPEVPLIISASRDATMRIWKLPEPVSARHTDREEEEPHHLDDSNNPYLRRVLRGHTATVRDISAYGDTLVSGSYDGTIRVWRISTGEMLHMLEVEGHDNSKAKAKVYHVIINSKRNRCISGSMDHVIRIWDLEKGSLLYSLEDHSSVIGVLNLACDVLVSICADGMIKIWDPANGQCKRTIVTGDRASSQASKHDSHKLIAPAADSIKMWDIQTGECIRELVTGVTAVLKVDFDGERCVAVVQRDGETCLEIVHLASRVEDACK